LKIIELLQIQTAKDNLLLFVSMILRYLQEFIKVLYFNQIFNLIIN